MFTSPFPSALQTVSNLHKFHLINMSGINPTSLIYVSFSQYDVHYLSSGPQVGRLRTTSQIQTLLDFVNQVLLGCLWLLSHYKVRAG